LRNGKSSGTDCKSLLAFTTPAERHVHLRWPRRPNRPRGRLVEQGSRPAAQSTNIKKGRFLQSVLWNRVGTFSGTDCKSLLAFTTPAERHVHLRWPRRPNRPRGRLVEQGSRPAAQSTNIKKGRFLQSVLWNRVGTFSGTDCKSLLAFTTPAERHVHLRWPRRPNRPRGRLVEQGSRPAAQSTNIKKGRFLRSGLF